MVFIYFAFLPAISLKSLIYREIEKKTKQNKAKQKQKKKKEKKEVR